MNHLKTILLIIFGVLNTSNYQTDKYWNSYEDFDPQYRSIYSCKIMQNSIEGKVSVREYNFNKQQFAKDWQQSADAIESSLTRWKIGAEVIAGGAKVLKDGTIDLIADNKFSKITPVSQLIAPYAKALANRFGESAIDMIKDELIESKTDEFEENIRMSLDNFLVEQKYAYRNNNLPHVDELTKSYIALLNSKFDRENQPIFNKIMLEKAYKYINENRDIIANNVDRLNTLDIRFGKLTEKFEGLSQLAYQNQKDIRSNRKEIDNLRKELTEEIDRRFGELSESISKIAENQQRNTEAIDYLGKQVANNSDKIKDLETDLKKVNIRLDEFDAKLKEHGSLIEENRYYIDVISTYSYNALDLKGKVKAFENKELPSIKKLSKENPALYQAKLDTLKGLERRQDFVQIVSYTQAIANKGYGTLVNNGWLKGKDAERVGKFMEYFNAGANIALAYAAPGPMTISNAIFSTMSLFGKKKKGPSPEMQMLRKIYERMEERFNAIDRRLDIVDEKLDTLISLNIQIHESIMEAIEVNYEVNQIRFNNIDAKLADIQEKVERTIDMTRISNEALKFLIHRGILQCNASFERFAELYDSEDVGYKFRNYDELNKFWGSCSSCATALNAALNTRENVLFKVQINKNITEYKTYYQVYEPAFEIYNYIYNRRDLMNISSSIPINDLDKNYLIAKELLVNADNILETDRLSFNYAKISDKNELLNPVDIFYIAEAYLKFLLPYNDFIDTRQGGNLRIKSLDAYYDASAFERDENISRAQRQIKFLHKQVEKAIVQHTILSGHHLVDKVYGIVYDSKHRTQVSNAMKVLKNNSMLANNFAKYTVYNNLFITSDSFARANNLQAYSVIVDSLENSDKYLSKTEVDELINKLEGIVANIKPIKFIYESRNKQVYLQVINPKDNNDSAYIPAPSLDELSSYKMDYLPVVYQLFNLKSDLEAAYFDVSVMSEVGRTEGVTIETYKGLFYETLNERFEN